MIQNMPGYDWSCHDPVAIKQRTKDNLWNPQSQCNHNAIHGIKSAHPWNLNRKLNYFKICNFHRAPVALTDVYIKLILTAIHNPSTIRVQSTVSKVHPYCKRTRWRTFNVPNTGQQLPTVQHPLHWLFWLAWFVEFNTIADTNIHCISVSLYPVLVLIL